MSAKTLMNPDHLMKEIHDLETELIPDAEKLSAELKEDYERVLMYFTETHNHGENTTLTVEQTRDVLLTLAKFNHNRYRYSMSYKFNLRVYMTLLKDRRWIIASKLKFLQK